MRNVERVYRAKRAGQALLVCGKCEKKLGGALKVKKGLKRLAKGDGSPVGFYVMRVGCLKLCPKGGVAVCTREGLGKDPVEMRVIWGKKDLAGLYKAGRVGLSV